MNQKRVSNREVAAFAAPAAPLLALTLPTIMFLPPHFIEHVGLEEWVVGAIFLGARLFDIVLDPLMGSWQDRTKTRWGRRRIWLAASTPPLMFFVWLVFIALPPGASNAYATIAVFAMYFVFANMMVAHLGWSGEIDPTYHGRTRTLAAVQIASAIGQAVMLIIAGAVVQALHGSNADAVETMGWVIIILLPITVTLACLGARERETPPQEHLTLAQSISTVFSNVNVRRVLLPDLLLALAQGISGGLFLFYFQFILGFEREAQTLAALYFVAGLIGVPLWSWVGKTLGKHRALQGAFLYTATTTLFLLMPINGNFILASILMIFAGLANGGCILLTRALMADVVDDDEVRTGQRRSGLFFGLLLMTSKAGLASGPICLAILQAFDFSAREGMNNSPGALAALSTFFIGAPVLLSLLGWLSLRNYKLDENAQATLAAVIEERQVRNSENTAGPSTK